MKKLTTITILFLFVVTVTAGVVEAALWSGNAGDNDWFNGSNWNGGIVPGNAATGTSVGGALGALGGSTYAIIDGNAGAYESLNLPGLTLLTGSPPSCSTCASDTHRLDVLNGAQVNLTGGAAEFRMRQGGNAASVELNISGNSVVDSFMSGTTFLQSDGGNPNLVARLNLGDANSEGTFNISNGSNTFGEQQGGSPATAPMTIRGVGAVSRTGGPTTMAMFATKFVADGWGGAGGRVLDLSSWEGQSRDEQVAGSDWGFYAQNGAELKLFTVLRNTQYTGVGDMAWHEGAMMDKINGFGVKNAQWPVVGVYVTGSVLAVDHPDVLAQEPLVDPIGAWNVSGVQMDNTTVSFRYDSALAATLGVDESDLKIFGSTNNSPWVNMTSSVDMGNHIISTHLLSASQIAYSTFVVAERIGIDSGADCDFTGDSACDVADIDDLFGQGNLVTGVSAAGSVYDLTGDGTLNGDDVAVWLSDAATENGQASAYLSSDVDLDRDIDLTDFNTLATSFSPSSSAGLFSTGDGDGDGDVDLSDYNTLAGSFTPTGYGGAAAVPEPVSLVLLSLGGVLVLFRRWGGQ
jgi:hypothetical protein